MEKSKTLSASAEQIEEAVNDVKSGQFARKDKQNMFLEPVRVAKTTMANDRAELRDDALQLMSQNGGFTYGTHRIQYAGSGGAAQISVANAQLQINAPNGLSINGNPIEGGLQQIGPFILGTSEAELWENLWLICDELEQRNVRPSDISFMRLRCNEEWFSHNPGGVLRVIRFTSAPTDTPWDWNPVTEIAVYETEPWFQLMANGGHADFIIKNEQMENNWGDMFNQHGWFNGFPTWVSKNKIDPCWWQLSISPNHRLYLYPEYSKVQGASNDQIGIPYQMREPLPFVPIQGLTLEFWLHNQK